MKKYQKIVCCVLLVFVFGTSFSFAQDRSEVVDIRAQGMGHAMLADSETVYTLFDNPAGLAFAGKKVLWPPIISANIGGELEGMFDICKQLIDGTTEEALLNSITGLIGPNGFNFNTKIGGPLTFGRINNNYGWGLLSTIALEGNIPSLTKSDIEAGLDLDLYFGYAVPLNFGALGTLSAGASIRGIAGFGVEITEGLTNIIGGSLDMSALPMNISLGIGLDLGLQYDIFNFVSVVAVLKDCFTPTWTKNLSETDGKFEYATIDPQLALGVGVDLPVEKWTNNILSHLAIHLEYENFLQFTKTVYRNPILELSGGLELEFIDMVALRFGLHEMYPAAGFGLYFGGFRIDYSIYGKELGLEPGYNPQLNMGLSISIQY